MESLVITSQTGDNALRFVSTFLSHSSPHKTLVEAMISFVLEGSTSRIWLVTWEEQANVRRIVALEAVPASPPAQIHR